MVAATGQPEVAADLTAEAYVRALERWSTVRRHPAPLAWVLRVAIDLHRSRWRRWQRELAHRQQHREPAHGQDSLPFDPALCELIQGLPRRQREVLAMRVVLDLSTAVGAATTVYGRVDPTVDEVVVRRDDGVDVGAQVAEGWWLAFWPGDMEPIRIDGRDDAGDTIVSFERASSTWGWARRRG